jgi:serine/threonine-protein kinase RsbW
MPEPRRTVSVEIPAQAEYVAVLRAAASVIATRLDFSLDEIDDLRILVDEAASLLIVAGAQDTLRCAIDADGGSIALSISGNLPPGASPASEGFAWSIVRALAHRVESRTSGTEHTIAVTRRRGPVLHPAT